MYILPFLLIIAAHMLLSRRVDHNREKCWWDKSS